MARGARDHPSDAQNCGARPPSGLKMTILQDETEREPAPPLPVWRREGEKFSKSQVSGSLKNAKPTTTSPAGRKSTSSLGSLEAFAALVRARRFRLRGHGFASFPLPRHRLRGGHRARRGGRQNLRSSGKLEARKLPTYARHQSFEKEHDEKNRQHVGAKVELTSGYPVVPNGGELGALDAAARARAPGLPGVFLRRSSTRRPSAPR